MQDVKQKGSAQSDDKKLDERKSEATNDETLREIEDSQTSSRSGGKGRGPGPSPDGTLDEPGEVKDAGPM